MTVIDVHTHQLHQDWLKELTRHGGNYTLGELAGGLQGISLDGSPFMTLTHPMLDLGLRISAMDKAGVDVAILSLTCPSVYWGGKEVSSKLARTMNRHWAAAQTTYPARIRWFATLPWQYPDAAVKELKQAEKEGAVGVFVAANLGAMHLTDPVLEPIWQQIEKLDLPVLVHPTTLQGMDEKDLRKYNLVAAVGSMFDTTLCFSRMILDGFLDRHPNLKLIAAHAGGTLPYLAGRLDMCFENMPACREKITTRPSEYLRRLYYDSVTFTDQALQACVNTVGHKQVMYGSDFPHDIGDMKGCLARVNNLQKNQHKSIRSNNAVRVFTRL